MSEFSRRDFLRGMTAAASAVAFQGSARAGEPAVAAKKTPKGTDVVKLGRSGLETTVLGIGTGTVGGSQQRAMGQEGFTKFTRHALERGVRYVDTADMYQMHATVAKALEGVPRDKYFIQTKTTAKKAELARADVKRFLKELKTDYVDSLLMHCMTKRSWPADMRPVLDVLREAKSKGQVRAVGISCHGWDPLEASVDAEGIDIQLARINPFGLAMDATPDKVAGVLKKLHENGRGVIGMKIFGETGLKNREQRFDSLKYVLGLGCVDCFTIGFTSMAQLDETLDMIERVQAG